jgi:hypothetical protein
MPTQLTLDFTSRPQPTCVVNADDNWLDVTDIAHGLGFTEPVQISLSLNDALAAHQDDPDDAYHQRLFDCLWLAHLQWSLTDGEAATLNFFFERADTKEEIRLRIRIEAQAAAIRIGMAEDCVPAIR